MYILICFNKPKPSWLNWSSQFITGERTPVPPNRLSKPHCNRIVSFPRICIFARHFKTLNFCFQNFLQFYNFSAYSLLSNEKVISGPLLESSSISGDACQKPKRNQIFFFLQDTKKVQIIPKMGGTRCFGESETIDFKCGSNMSFLLWSVTGRFARTHLMFHLNGLRP